VKKAEGGGQKSRCFNLTSVGFNTKIGDTALLKLFPEPRNRDGEKVGSQKTEDRGPKSRCFNLTSFGFKAKIVDTALLKLFPEPRNRGTYISVVFT
jgi:hypothetical protein